MSTYLTAAGEPLVDANGDFTIADTVPRKEHRRRLTMYRSPFQTRLDTLSGQEDRDDLARALCWEARQRLAQQKAARYIAPVDASGFKWTPSWFRTEKRLFGSKVVANKHWKVRIGAYDARCRLFIARMYGMGRGYHSFTLDGVEAAQRPAVESLLMFLESPTTRNGPLPEKLK